MKTEELGLLLDKLLASDDESEWLEFKENYADPEEIGEYVSAVANGAALCKQQNGYIVWGIQDNTKAFVGTSFEPRRKKVGAQELENFLVCLTHTDIAMHEFSRDGLRFVIFEVPAASRYPVRFRETEYIRVGSYKKKLKDHPEKERTLWSTLEEKRFETELARENVPAEEVLRLLDFATYFELKNQPIPDRSLIFERLESEQFIRNAGPNTYDITNLGAIVFAKNLPDFDRLARKAVRIIVYDGANRVNTLSEQLGKRGYAVGFEHAVAYINNRLPHNEEIGQALRKQVRMYPEAAIRELFANALIHQDFSITGTGPTVEIFSDRIEFTNPGTPLIDPLRFIDSPPQSRNEDLAYRMRLLGFCEERGSGIDRAISEVELYQLPPPEFIESENHTKAVLYAHRVLFKMKTLERVRACYQHACLRYVSNQFLANCTLRARFGIEHRNHAIASRIISDTVKAGLIKPYDPDNTSKKLARYVPIWA